MDIVLALAAGMFVGSAVVVGSIIWGVGYVTKKIEKEWLSDE